MKVLTVSHAYAVEENRLVWKRLVDLYPAVDVTLVTPKTLSIDRYGPSVTYEARPEEQGNYHVCLLPLEGSRFQRYVGLGAMLRNQRPDIVCVAQQRFSWSTYVALIHSKLYSRSTKTISYTLVNIDYHLKLPHHLLKEKLYFGLCDAILASDGEALAILRQHGYRGVSQNLYLLGAVDERPSRSAPRLTHAPVIIGYAGKLSEEKGISELIRAVAQLKGDWRLELVGGGDTQSEIEQQIVRLGIQDRVILHGFCPRSDMMRIMQTFDVFVLPSRTTPAWKEQFGVVLVEAMMSSAVVVGSSSGAIPEVIGDAGFIFPERDIGALANILQGLLDDNEMRKTFALKGYRRALETYSTTAMAHQFYQFGQTLLNSK